jgi:hypothetical protein
VAQGNGIAVWAEGIKAELKTRLPRQRKTQRDKLSVLVATMLHVRSANLVELAAGLPRESDRWDMGYQWISRFLANDLVCCDAVMAPFAHEILARLAETGEPIPLILDQTRASERHQIVMLSVRWGERALPLAWRVEETEGAIGFAVQKELLEGVAGWLPADQPVILLADRFYGTPEMIRWCRDRGWDYRLRLKSNLLARRGATRTTTGALALSGGHYFENVVLTGKRVITNIGILRDPGHAEPWIIAMAAKPGYLTTLGYAARWGIEPMFSDFKSRGFGLEQTHIHYPDRLARLILVMSLALYWAVSTGMWDQATNPIPAEKNDRTVSPQSSHAESSPGSRAASGAPSNSSSAASLSPSSGDAC